MVMSLERQCIRCLIKKELVIITDYEVVIIFIPICEDIKLSLDRQNSKMIFILHMIFILTYTVNLLFPQSVLPWKKT